MVVVVVVVVVVDHVSAQAIEAWPVEDAVVRVIVVVVVSVAVSNTIASGPDPDVPLIRLPLLPPRQWRWRWCGESVPSSPDSMAVLGFPLTAIVPRVLVFAAAAVLIAFAVGFRQQCFGLAGVMQNFGLVMRVDGGELALGGLESGGLRRAVRGRENGETRVGK